MKIRIGVTYTAKELELELEDSSADEVRASVETAMGDDDAVLWLTDSSGKTIGIPADKLGWVELSETKSTRIGFAAT